MRQVQNVSLLLPHQNYLLQELENVVSLNYHTTATRRRAAQGSRTQRMREGRGEAAGRRYPAWPRDARPE